jgi:hypothetical protein
MQSEIEMLAWIGRSGATHRDEQSYREHRKDAGVLFG